MSGDPEFDDFLRRRRPLFREFDDGLEPPPELDRVVLRNAREAIETDRPIRLLGMPQWAAPVAIAATLVVGLAIVFKAGHAPAERVPEVRVENVAQQFDYPPAASQAPAWRRDAQTWQAEIQRLRARGEAARADAEQAEFNRQYRALATSPDH